MMLVIILCGQLKSISDSDADADDNGGGGGGVFVGEPDEAVLPEDVEELPGQGAGHRPHLLLHNVRHPRHFQLNPRLVKPPWNCETR